MRRLGSGNPPALAGGACQSRKTTQKYLQALFTAYANEYFGDRLPAGCKIRITTDPRLIDPKLHTGRYHARHRVIVMIPGRTAELTRQTLLHEMAHAAIHGQVMSAATATWEIGMKLGLASASLTEAVASSLAPLLVGAGHGAAWQREMWRLALDHGETWAVRDIAVHNQAVRVDLLARYEQIPHTFTRHSDVFAMRAAAIYYKAELRAPYLPEVYGPSFGVASSEPRPTATAPVYLNDEEEDQ